MIALLFLISGAFAALPSDQLQFFDDFCESTNIGLLPLSSPWCTNSDPCTWSGVECDSLSGSVVERLVLDFNVTIGIEGEMPPSVSSFMSLVEFTLYCAGSYLSGNLPDGFIEQNAETLLTFQIVQCPLIGGKIPEQSGLPITKTFHVFSTNIGTTITSTFLEESPALEELTISASNLVGPLPDTSAWDELVNLKILDLSSNKINESIPVALCDLPAIEQIFLQKNYITVFPLCLGQTLDSRVICDLRDNYYCTNYPDPSTISPCVVGAKEGDLPPPDQCDVCGGNGLSCVGCDGVPFSTREFDACGECGGTATTPGDCPDCAGTIGGSLVYDACGTCGGDNSTCLDCAGVPNGSSKYDPCHVCDGDGKSCIDCYGQHWGTAKYDLCGVCNGDSTTCFDCNGIAAGSDAFDVCGVCGGSGTSCLDCAGVVNGTATRDEWGRCSASVAAANLAVSPQSGNVSLGDVALILGVLLVFACCPVLVCLLVAQDRRRR